MAITAKTVGELRERTGASMMECKRALEAAGGDLEAAVDQLRKAGLKTAEKKAGRDTGQGRVAALVRADGRAGALVALACETDFVALNDEFQALLRSLCAIVLEHGPKEVEGGAGSLFSLPHPTGGTVEAAVKAMIGKMGENLRVTQIARLESPEGRVLNYVHHDNKKGVLVALKALAPTEKIDAFGKQLCMHITAAIPVPQFLRREEVPADELARERAVIEGSDDMQKKPADMREKIVTGRLEKFFAERVLPEQPFVLDESQTVRKALAAALGADARIEGFARFQVGR